MSEGQAILIRANAQAESVARVCGYRDAAELQRANARAAERKSDAKADSSFVALWIATFEAARAA